MYKNGVTVEVLVNGNPITEYHKNGKTYVEGRKGSEYSIKITNNTSGRILAIPTVDGLSVINGKPGSVKDSPGYIIPAWGFYVVDGWRTNLENIRKFHFTRNNQSYSKKSGQGTQNNGVIGVSCFEEQNPGITINNWPRPWTPPKWPSDNDWWLTNTTLKDDLFGASNKTLARSINYSDTSIEGAATIGTGMGSSQQSVVSEASFNKKSNSFANFVFYYLERKQLKRMGIIPHSNYNVQTPNPFPRSKNFCREV